MTGPGAPIGRSAHGQLKLRLDPTERHLLASLVAELRTELEDPASAAPGGSLARLFPPAFPDDPDREAAFVDLVRADLREDRLGRVAVVEASLAADTLDEAQAAAWVAVLNDARLVLGASLGLDEAEEGRDEAEDGPHDEQASAGGGDVAPSSDDPDAIRRAIFGYLGWLVGSFVDVLAASLPDVPDEAA